MARTSRVECPGAIYNVMNRGDWRELDTDDYHKSGRWML